MSLLVLALMSVLGYSQARAEAAEKYAEACARVSGLANTTCAATFHDESKHNPRAKSSVGARGVGQLFRGNAYWKPWRRHCYQFPAECDIKGAEYAGLALRYYVDRCGGLTRGLTGYRVGHCKTPGPKAKATARLKRRLDFAVHAEIHKALLPLVLP